MGTSVFLARLLVAVVLDFGFVVMQVSPTAAQVGTATITIHKAECPTETDDVFGDCQDNGLEGVDFWITDTEVSETFTTDADGVIVVTMVAGSIDIEENPDVPADYLGAYVYCSDQNTGEVFLDGDLDGADSIFGTIEAGADLVCDWYNITEADDDGDDAADDNDDDIGSGTTLPSTGIGSADGTGDTTQMLMLSLLALAVSGAAFSLRRHSAR